MSDSISLDFQPKNKKPRRIAGFLGLFCIKMRALRHIKTRNRKGYENHVITLYSVVTWFFFYKFCLVFREFKADLIVTWLKCVAFLGYPSLAGKMGKWEKWVRFFREIGTLYKIQKKNLCNMICFPKKEWYWIISLNMTDKRKRILTTRFSILNISKM